MGWFGKQKQKDSGLDVLTEIKEPFSFANFFEEQVAERFRKMKTFLDEKGILFFLLSPFQQRNRLIAQLVLITFGVLIGIVPRSAQLIDAAKERNAASEMAALIENNTQLSVGRIQIRPLASSQYGKQHLLAFLISENGSQSVPSTASRYTVDLSVARGVSDPEHVSYSYQVLPVTEEQRLLLVYTDNRKQNDSTGIYNLRIMVTDDQLDEEEQTPMEVVLSNTQQTNDLFDEGGIDLSVLTEPVLNDTNTPVADADGELKQALEDYELELERIAGLPIDMEVEPSLETLTAYVDAQTLYPDLTDASTTEDIQQMKETEQAESLVYPAGITYEGTLYRSDAYASYDSGTDPSDPAVTAGDQETADAGDKEQQQAYTDQERRVMQELDSVQSRVDDVIRALNSRNSAAQTKFQTLDALKLVLNQSIDVASFPQTGTVGQTGE